MFSQAYDIASIYTQPVLISNRTFNGEVKSGLGSFVIINDEGWIITAAHILNSLIAFQKHSIEIQDYNNKILDIENDPKLSSKAKSNKKKKIRPNSKWIINSSHWWGHDNHKINQFNIFNENDIAIGQIENYNRKF